MKLSTTISNLMMALVGILTSCGVAVYDGQFVRVAAQSSVRSTNSLVTVDVHTDPGAAHVQHAHSDYNPSGSTLSNSFQYPSPSVTPRRRSHHKQLLKMLEIGGRHAFNDIHMPLLS